MRVRVFGSSLRGWKARKRSETELDQRDKVYNVVHFERPLMMTEVKSRALQRSAPLSFHRSGNDRPLFVIDSIADLQRLLSLAVHGRAAIARSACDCGKQRRSLERSAMARNGGI